MTSPRVVTGANQARRRRQCNREVRGCRRSNHALTFAFVMDKIAADIMDRLAEQIADAFWKAAGVVK